MAVIRAATTVAGVRFKAVGACWKGKVGRVTILLEPKPRGVWRWSLDGTHGERQWWGTAKPRYRAMAVAVRHAKAAA